MSRLISRHPLATFYALTFGISWGAFLLVVRGMPGTAAEVTSLTPAAILAFLLGPLIATLVCLGFGSGRAGFAELLARLRKWRVGARWYAALLLAPISMLAIPLALSLIYPEFLPRIFTAEGKLPTLLLALFAALGAGFFEELGWTGFVIPRVRRRVEVLATGLLVGLLWGAWHFIVNLWSSGTPGGALSWPLFLHSFLFSVLVLTPYRVLMVWVYDRTGSLLLAMLLHASLTFSNVLLVPAATATGVGLVVWSLSVAAALWIAVAALVLRERNEKGVLRLTPAQFSR